MDFAHLDIPLRDGHIHFPLPALLGDLLAVMEIAGVTHANLVAVPDLHLANQNAALIHAKARYPDRFTLCGALDYTVLESAEFVTREANQGRIYHEQPASAIFGIKALIGLIPGVALTLGAIILIWFPLQGAHLARMQEQVLALHGKKHAQLERRQGDD